ncbi:MAG: SGNH/GDSL hydrolase family protein [Nanoarchaeota archaeon]|nr:SGNH/GDSL hydrolase family protein [Nanoarchaeota archaeon]
MKEIKRIIIMTRKVAREEGLGKVFYSGIKMIINRTIGYLRYFVYFIQSRLFRKKYIHVIGDSHTASFNKNRSFFVHHISHATAHNLIIKHSTSNSNEKFWKIINKISKNRDMVILVFGEIDSRIHIYYQYKKQGMKEPISSLIDKTIERYGVVLEELEKRGISFFVYGIPPANKEGNIYNIPFYASEKKRAEINRVFNDKLRDYCKDRRYKYIDIYPETCNEEGFIKKVYAEDEVHLNKNIIPFVMNCLKMNSEKGLI